MSGNLVERAFELAKSGRVRSLDDIRRTLTGEGFTHVESHLAGRSLRRQLKGLIAGAVDR